MQNFAALRDAVFAPSTKNFWGGGYLSPSPSVRGLNNLMLDISLTIIHSFDHRAAQQLGIPLGKVRTILRNKITW